MAYCPNCGFDHIQLKKDTNCVAVGETAAEVKTLIQEAIEFHLESFQEDCEQMPLPNSSIEYIEAKISA